MIRWFYIYDIIPLQCMISVTYDIICLWYHNQYHMQNQIWYHGIKTMISYVSIYDISNLWYHRSMIYDHIHDLTYDLAYDITVNPHINTILQTNDFNVSILHCAVKQSLAEARNGTWQWWGAESCGLKSGSLGWRVPYARPADGNVSTVKVTTHDRPRPAPARWAQHHPRRPTAQALCLSPASKPQRRRGRRWGRGRLPTNMNPPQFYMQIYSKY